MKKSTRRGLALLCALLLLAQAACSLHGRGGGGLSPEGAALVGTWEDLETGSLTIVALREGRPVVQSVVDGDGENFPITQQHWDGRTLTFTYQVPSSGYLVEIVFIGVEGERLAATWSNQAPDGQIAAGSQDFQRVR